MVRSLPLLLLLVLCCPVTARAATVSVTRGLDPGTGADLADARFTAAPGEVNRLTVHVTGAVLTLRDPGALLTAGDGCAAIDAHSATCGMSGAVVGVTVTLGDGDDTALIEPGDANVGGSIDGGAGADRLDGTGAPRDVGLLGGPGADRLRGGPGGDYLAGGDGDDVLLGGDGPDELIGGAGADHLAGGDGQNRLDGGAGDDRLAGGSAPDTLAGGSGADVLSAGGDNDELDGGRGRDALHGGAGDDVLDGDREAPYDLLVHHDVPARDLLDGGPGSDDASWADHVVPVRADLERPAVAGARGERDRLIGIEDLQGGHATDVLAGDDGPNRLFDTVGGGREGDLLVGRGGDDVLQGGLGARGGPVRLVGGPGTDVVHAGPYARVSCGKGLDRIDGIPSRYGRLTFLHPGCDRVGREAYGSAPTRISRLRRNGGWLRGTFLRGPYDSKVCGGSVTVAAPRAGHTTASWARPAPLPRDETVPVRAALPVRLRAALARHALVRVRLAVRQMARGGVCGPAETTLRWRTRL